MKSGKKRPSTQFKVHTSKQPKISPLHDVEWSKSRPSWRMSRLDMDGPFGWRDIEKGKIDDILSKLANLEGRTWAEILVKSKKQNHTVLISAMSGDAQRRLEKIKQADLAELTSLRLSGKERIWGILDRNVLSLLWWDPEHLVCPSKK